MKNNHDPYLTTVQRSLNEQRIKTRKEQVRLKKDSKSKKGFFSQTFELRQLIDLPEGLQEVVLFGMFLLIPYVIGALSMILYQFEMGSLQNSGIQGFLFAWTIGYEFCASLLLITLIQQSFTYRNVG